MKRTITVIALAALWMTSFTFAQGKPLQILEKSGANRQSSARPLGVSGDKLSATNAKNQPPVVGDYKSHGGMTAGMYRPPGSHNLSNHLRSLRQSSNPEVRLGPHLNHGSTGDSDIPELRAGDGSGVPNPNPPPCCRV